MEWLKEMSQREGFTEVAFLVAMLLILGAWKFGIEGLTD